MFVAIIVKDFNLVIIFIIKETDFMQIILVNHLKMVKMHLIQLVKELVLIVVFIMESAKELTKGQSEEFLSGFALILE